ncbi:MAG: hypothetical protein N2Z22_03710 [Turneriella sp.]|nr:hypothetical protein [Turneriella sp.]
MADWPAEHNYARLFGAIAPEELQRWRELDWLPTPPPGDVIFARTEQEFGIVELGGALPFLETRKVTRWPENVRWLKSEILARFLLVHPALYRSYLQLARKERYPILAGPQQGMLVQVAAETPGMEAAAFAIFLATRAEKLGMRVLLVDGDDKNQFLFPLLGLQEMPPLLTENLQKPSTFRSDLSRCVVKLGENRDYLNLHATTLRPFNEEEISRICGYVLADYDCVVFYSGRYKSRWLSTQAELTFACGDGSWRCERSSILAHTGSPHLVLLRPSSDIYYPGLTAEFGRKLPEDQFAELPPQLETLARYVDHLLSARTLLWGHNERAQAITASGGAVLYRKLLGVEDAGEKSLNALQKKLRARYPGKSFFTLRSALRAASYLPRVPVSIIVSVAAWPQLVSLPYSDELLAIAIFPRGAIPPPDPEITAAGPATLRRLATTALRGQFKEFLTSPPLTAKESNALAALMLQLQP